MIMLMSVNYTMITFCTRPVVIEFQAISLGLVVMRFIETMHRCHRRFVYDWLA